MCLGFAQKLIRMEQRIKAGLFSLHGVELAPIEKTIETGGKQPRIEPRSPRGRSNRQSAN